VKRPKKTRLVIDDVPLKRQNPPASLFGPGDAVGRAAACATLMRHAPARPADASAITAPADADYRDDFYGGAPRRKKRRRRPPRPYVAKHAGGELEAYCATC
jgi:hypothetical protein